MRNNLFHVILLSVVSLLLLPSRISHYASNNIFSPFDYITEEANNRTIVASKLPQPLSVDNVSTSNHVVETNDQVVVFVKYYSRVHSARSGSVALDMLQAHAYTYFLMTKQLKEQQQRRLRIDATDQTINFRHLLHKCKNKSLVASSTKKQTKNVSFMGQSIFDECQGRKLRERNLKNILWIPQYFGGCANMFIQRGKNYKTTVELLHGLKWINAIPMACPPYSIFQTWNYNKKVSQKIITYNETNTNCNNNIVNRNKVLVLHAESTYKPYGSTLLTSEWLQYFLSQARAPSMAQSTILLDELNKITNFRRSKGDNNTVNNNLTSAVVVDDDEMLLYKQGAIMNITVLVRRGDVHPCDSKTYERYLPNSYYLQLIDEYVMERQPKYVNVTVFSESNSYESFDAFREKNYTVLLDTPLLPLWETAMKANLLILSKSKFSFIPGLFNPNTVLFAPFSRYRPPERGINHNNNNKPWVIVRNELIQKAKEKVEIFRKNENCIA